jgi:uncharacterized RDD family membrane protein YckC
MKTSKQFLVSGGICAVLALVCITLFETLGASIDAQGVLHEQFALIPLAWMFLLAALYFAFRFWRQPRI